MHISRAVGMLCEAFCRQLVIQHHSWFCSVTRWTNIFVYVKQWHVCQASPLQWVPLRQCYIQLDSNFFCYETSSNLPFLILNTKQVFFL